MQMNLRKALLDSPQHLFVPVDLQIRMQPSLHQHSCAAQLYRFMNLVVNRLEVEDVSLSPSGPLQWPVERRERAVLGGEICVIDIPVNDVGNYTFRVQLAADCVRFHTYSDQVV